MNSLQTAIQRPSLCLETRETLSGRRKCEIDRYSFHIPQSSDNPNLQKNVAMEALEDVLKTWNTGQTTKDFQLRLDGNTIIWKMKSLNF